MIIKFLILISFVFGFILDHIQLPFDDEEGSLESTMIILSGGCYLSGLYLMLFVLK